MPTSNAHSQAFGRWAQDAVQLSRPGAVVADSTRDNSIQAARAVLGWAKNVSGREGEPDMCWLLDGDLLAAYVSWGGAVRCDGASSATLNTPFAHALRPYRKKKPISLSTEVSSVVRLLEFLGSAVRLDEASLKDLDRLKASMRRLANQLTAMHRPTTTIEALEAAGKWAELEIVQEKVRAEATSVMHAVESAHARDSKLARRIHDSLMCMVVTVDCAPNRPGCLRMLKVPGSDVPCDCGHDGCEGNSFRGSVMTLTHSKTQRHRDAIKVDFAGTLTERLLENHLLWGRELLLSPSAVTDALWISSRGTAFGSDESFAAYLPRTLARLDLPHLSYTTLRHAAVVASSEWATRDELEGMARAIGTSVRKMTQVYDYRCAQRSSCRFLTAYRAHGAASEGGDQGMAEAARAKATTAPAAELKTAPLAHVSPPASVTAPVHVPRSTAFNPLYAFGRLLGIRRVPDAEHGAASSAPQASGVVLDDEDGPWHGSFELPIGGASKLSSGSGMELALVCVPPHPALHLPPASRHVAASQLALARAHGHRMGGFDSGGGGGGGGGVVARAGGASLGQRNRHEVATSAGSFLEFLGTQKERKRSVAGPGRTAAPVKRWLTPDEADAAMQGSMAAQRAAYAWAYGFSTTSGNLAWLRSKIEAAVRQTGEGEEEAEHGGE
jgi:hypothetical protein